MSRVADTLASVGVARSDRVAIVMGNEAEAVDGKPTERCRAMAAALIKGGLKAPSGPGSATRSGSSCWATCASTR